MNRGRVGGGKTKEKTNTGVYTITNKINGKMYVGSTEEVFRKRWQRHKSELKKGIHSNGHIQNSVNKYGLENFEFEILQECGPEFCLSFEQYWRNVLMTYDENFGYDICYVAGKTTGYKHTDESKSKMRGIPKSEEYKKNMSFIKRGGKNPRARAVLQLTKEGKLIKEWEGLGVAARALDMNYQTISGCCRKERPTAGGFRWEYANP